MPKISQTPVSQADLVEFLDTESDFAFELRTLECLCGLGFVCAHGGSYADPVTNKTRQYDIRAWRRIDALGLSWAVECKNLSASYPLLVMCVPRTESESFLELVESFPPGPGNPLTGDLFPPNCTPLRVARPLAYRQGDPVGKSLARVGRTLDKDRSFASGDGDVFEKWSQALASADDLAEAATRFGTKDKSRVRAVVLPILVVPDRTLWKVIYQADGSRGANPVQTDRCSLYVRQSFRIGDPNRFMDFTISHLEIVTLSGLQELSRTVFAEEQLRNDILAARKAKARP